MVNVLFWFFVKPNPDLDHDSIKTIVTRYDAPLLNDHSHIKCDSTVQYGGCDHDDNDASHNSFCSWPFRIRWLLCMVLERWHPLSYAWYCICSCSRKCDLNITNRFQHSLCTHIYPRRYRSEDRTRLGWHGRKNRPTLHSRE